MVCEAEICRVWSILKLGSLLTENFNAKIHVLMVFKLKRCLIVPNILCRGISYT